ncbi:Charged multivesicular body protein 1b [Willisornis vidua]|uniref:Charged multivesicular body protein 1b n=1 Tax=Willisornis vidua TaxID=1566151 RepID=A0ABQ9DCQ8_9PASS|nr:Charged multivesicular body protein 1b [Willisornis vidua]
MATSETPGYSRDPGEGNPFKTPEVSVWLDREAVLEFQLSRWGLRESGAVTFAAKELNRNSKKCDKEEKAEKAKIKKAIQKGNMEVARIHAENAIRQKNQAINFLRMSARVDAVAARVQTAVTMGKVTKSMAGVVKSMDATLKSMNLEKISALMDKFEHQFETLDVQTQQMEDTMSNTTTLTTPQNQVDMLLQEMADEAGLDLNMELPQGQTGSVGTSVASAEQDELSQRLARLRDQV